MTNLKVFKSEEFGQVRTVAINGKPYFVGKDISDALGYLNSRDAIATHVFDEDKADVGIHDGRQTRKMCAINESGLYSLIFGSKLNTAKRFKHWVTSEVLPSIRKHGMYATEDLLNNPDLLIQVATTLKQEREKNLLLEKDNKAKEQIIGELKPLADYTDLILKNKGLVTPTQIAKDYGMSAQEMNDLLHKLGIQYKQSGQWFLYAKYHELGYTHSDTINITRSDGRPDIKMNTKWTQKGRLFIYEVLKNEGVVPVIERGIKNELP